MWFDISVENKWKWGVGPCKQITFSKSALRATRYAGVLRASDYVPMATHTASNFALCALVRSRGYAHWSGLALRALVVPLKNFEVLPRSARTSKWSFLQCAGRRRGTSSSIDILYSYGSL